MKHQAKNSEFHLSPSELRRLIAAASSLRDRLIIALFVYTGIRRAELQQLQRSDIDGPRERLLIRAGKGRKQRILYIPGFLLRELLEYSQRHGGEFLFPGRSGRAMSLRNINYIVAAVGRKAGIETPNPRYSNVSPHLLRHSFARNWKRTGSSLESLQRILGHASLKTTLDLYGTESQAETEANYREVIGQLALTPPLSQF